MTPRLGLWLLLVMFVVCFAKTTITTVSLPAVSIASPLQMLLAVPLEEVPIAKRILSFPVRSGRGTEGAG